MPTHNSTHTHIERGRERASDPTTKEFLFNEHLSEPITEGVYFVIAVIFHRSHSLITLQIIQHNKKEADKNKISALILLHALWLCANFELLFPANPKQVSYSGNSNEATWCSWY